LSASRHVLVVEDDRTIRSLVALWLPDDCEHHDAGSLADARALLAARTFDLVVLDLMLPDGEGDLLLSDIPRGTPIIAMSGSQRMIAEPGRVVSYLPKPFDPQMLTTLARQALRKR